MFSSCNGNVWDYDASIIGAFCPRFENEWMNERTNGWSGKYTFVDTKLYTVCVSSDERELIFAARLTGSIDTYLCAYIDCTAAPFRIYAFMFFVMWRRFLLRLMKPQCHVMYDYMYICQPIGYSFFQNTHDCAAYSRIEIAESHGNQFTWTRSLEIDFVTFPCDSVPEGLIDTCQVICPRPCAFIVIVARRCVWAEWTAIVKRSTNYRSHGSFIRSN